MAILWRRSYPEVVSSGHRYWAVRRYLDAAREYWLAAYVAPTAEQETLMLRLSWRASERSAGRPSELEPEA